MTNNAKEYHRRYREQNIEKRREWNREWIQNNREKYNAQKAKYRDKLKTEAFHHYGEGTICCKYCGFDNIDALCLDHINNDGNIHRKSMGQTRRAGINTYEKLRKAGYPGGIQILCANCNQIKEVERKRAARLENKFYLEYYENSSST